MYNPSHFAEPDPAVLRDAARGFETGELITVGSDGLEASLLPLLVSDSGNLVTGHLARANRQWKRADPAVAALVTWRSPSAYVSPSYYPSKGKSGEVVPTLDYVTIQARGSLVIHHDDEWIRHLVRSLTERHEGGLGHPWSIDDAPGDFIDARLREIVGIELQVTSWEGKWKLSQNRSAEDVDGVIDALSAGDPDEARVGELVRLANGRNV